MTLNFRAPRALLFGLFFLLVFVAPRALGQEAKLTASGAAGEARSSAATSSAASASETSKYVGAETCKTCHEEIYNALGKDAPLENHA